MFRRNRAHSRYFFISVTTFFNATARKGIIAELKAEKPPVATKKKAMEIDN
ncbi:hypothetical protein BLN21_002819 [Salmonella enterica subsp. enterica serovar Bergen]|nr:hypothetical protein [Salmonella enterica subsp. enterica serovar Bergen]EDT6412053.1 hypothetical protein [Salmonella enterica subsp. enterica]EDZ5423584.1 hypothetical protein [Salmonella enterica]EED9170541.1 hypothetical protein [Salmonella enterica subsp. enterica serovar Bergen]